MVLTHAWFIYGYVLLLNCDMCTQNIIMISEQTRGLSLLRYTGRSKSTKYFGFISLYPIII